MSPLSSLRAPFGAVRLPVLAIVAVALLVNQADSQPPSAEQSYVYRLSAADRLHARLSEDNVRIDDATLQAEPLRRPYESRNYEPIWTGSRAAGANAKLALAALADSESEGLRAQDYRYDQLLASLSSPMDDKSKVDLDLLLTDSLLRYARDLRHGRARHVEVEEDAGLPSIGFDFGGALLTASANGSLSSFLTDLAPKHPEYHQLKLGLARYRAIEADGGWPLLPSSVTADGKNAEVLRARLVIEDESAAESDIKQALTRYQARNGLAADGVLGARTRAALNLPVEARIEQIRANMERWRWMPREFEARRIVVNVADATLQYIDEGTVALESKVIVGDVRHPTPILRAEATAVTVNPVWYVPESITSREIWPRLQRDPYYLQREGFIVAGQQLRQLPGPQNALGTLKIEMPNQFDVYLHDTPARSAFQRDARALSHGCVRVEQITALASIAISGDAQAKLGELSDIIAAGKTTRIDLDERIPVYLLYWTAIAEDDGHVRFPADIYGRDPVLLGALVGQQSDSRVASTELGP